MTPGPPQAVGPAIAPWGAGIQTPGTMTTTADPDYWSLLGFVLTRVLTSSNAPFDARPDAGTPISMAMTPLLRSVSSLSMRPMPF